MELVSHGSSLRLPPLRGERQIKSPKSVIGLQYTLSESRVPHNIPPPNAIKSSETDAGLIDTWPAHSTNQRFANIQSNQQLASQSTSALVAEPTTLTRKPRFLENLENFLYRELKVLGCTDSAIISEPRIQAFREVFEYLIEEFKTYKPILSAIKNEYELMLSYQREKIRELEPLKQMLVTLAEQCDHKLMEYREQERIEVKQLKDEKKKLLENIIELQQNMMTLHVTVEKLQNELALEHERYRDEYDKKKLLIAELNDVKSQQEEAKFAEMQREKKRAAERNQVIDGNIDENDSENVNPANLKLALKISRQNLADSMKRLTKMEVDYGDVIPRRDYIALETVYNELVAKGGNLEKDYKTMKFENTTLKETCKQLEIKLQDALHQIEYMKGSSTPRPDWTKCADAVDGGQDRWKQTIQGKSSNNIVDILLNEFTGSGHDTDSVEFFTGLGTSTNVLMHLRYDGQIKNRRLNRRDTATTVFDIWKEKSIDNAKRINETPMQMSDFVYQYFKSRFSSDKTVYEWCYNLKNACERFIYNEYIQFFAGVLNNDIDEEIYHFEHRLFHGLMQHFVNVEKKERNSDELVTGQISKQGFQAGVREYFDSKNNDDIDALLQGAQEELKTKSEWIDYRLLLSEDDEGRTGPFIAAIKRQLQKDRLTYTNDIKNVLMQKAVSLNEFRRAILLVDQNITEKEIERYVRWCMGALKGDANAKSYEVEYIVKRLENCCVYEHDTQMGKK